MDEVLRDRTTQARRAPPAREEPSSRTANLPPPRSSPEGGFNVVEPETLFEDARAFVRELGPTDRLAFFGAAGTVLVSFFPWQDTAADGEILGLMSLGAPVFLASLVVMGAIGVRVREAMPRLNALVLRIAQLGAAGFAILWCLVFIKLSWNGHKVPAAFGNYEVSISKPTYGVFLGLLTSVAALAGTLKGLRDKPA